MRLLEHTLDSSRQARFRIVNWNHTAHQSGTISEMVHGCSHVDANHHMHRAFISMHRGDPGHPSVSGRSPSKPGAVLETGAEMLDVAHHWARGFVGHGAHLLAQLALAPRKCFVCFRARPAAIRSVRARGVKITQTKWAACDQIDRPCLYFAPSPGPCGPGSSIIWARRKALIVHPNLGQSRPSATQRRPTRSCSESPAIVCESHHTVAGSRTTAG